jgi:hypothetical protein
MLLKHTPAPHIFIFEMEMFKKFFMQDKNVNKMYIIVRRFVSVNFFDRSAVNRFLILLFVFISAFPSLASAASKSDWLVLIYMSGGVAESSVGNATADISEIIDAQIDPSRVRVVIQTGGAKKWHLFNIPSGTVERYTVEHGKLINIDSIASQSMGDYSTLSDFLKFSNYHYEADHTMLIIWDHSTSGFLDGVARDEIYNDSLTPKELSSALADGVSGLKANQYDIIMADADNMATIDAIATLQPFTRLFIANEKIGPWLAWDYTTWLYRLSHEQIMSAEDLARMMIASYMLSCSENDYADISISLIDMLNAKNLLLDYNRLGCALTSNLQRGIITKAEVDRAAVNASLFGYGILQRNEKRKLGDLVDFKEFYTALSEHFPLEVSRLDEDMKKAVNVFARISYTYGNGISMYYPLSSVLFNSEKSHEIFSSVSANGYRSFMLLSSVAGDNFLNQRDLFELIRDSAKNYKIAYDRAENVSTGDEFENDYPYVHPKISSDDMKNPSSQTADSGSGIGSSSSGSEESSNTADLKPDENKQPRSSGSDGSSSSSVSAGEKTDPERINPEGLQTGGSSADGQSEECVYESRAISPISSILRYGFIEEDEAKILQDKVEFLDYGSSDDAADTEFLVIESTTDACVMPKDSALFEGGDTGRRTIGKKKQQLNEKKRRELNQKYAVKEIDFETYAGSLCRYVDKSASFAAVTFCNFIKNSGQNYDIPDNFKLPVVTYDDKSTGIVIDPKFVRNISDVNLQIGMIHYADAKIPDDRTYVVNLGTDDQLSYDWKKGEIKDTMNGALITIDNHLLPAVVIASTKDFVSYAAKVRVNHRDTLLFFIHDLLSNNFRIVCYFLVDYESAPHLMEAKLKSGDLISYTLPVYYPVAADAGRDGGKDSSDSSGEYSFVSGAISVHIDYNNEQGIGRRKIFKDPVFFRYEASDSRGNRFYSDYQLVQWNIEGERHPAKDDAKEILESWVKYMKSEEEKRKTEQNSEN